MNLWILDPRSSIQDYLHGMRKILLLLLIPVCSFSQPTKPTLIPQPVQLQVGEGRFLLHAASAISTSGKDEASQRIAMMLSKDLGRATGYKLPVRAGGVMTMNTGNILLSLNAKPDTALGDEGYRIKVTSVQVTITANKGAGLFYGTQTLLQLFPVEIASVTALPSMKWEVPVVDIMDRPRFGWRGLLFDVARHFFTKDEVKRFIDEMVRYKYNLLQLHLTDDEGWRIEIKSYPRLTTFGAWNVKKVGLFGDFDPGKGDEPRDYGGFYSQDDMKEIVRYAKDRFVDILPEVDVPGHSLAAVASYPELSCTPGAETYKTSSGENWWKNDPKFPGFDNTLCPANEKVYTFLDKVFGELVSIFPFGYIHVGGDECTKEFWKKSAAVDELMKREHLTTYQEAQSYFEKRVEKIVNAKGRKLIGWDEILEGGLAPGATVMSWRGMQGGIEAAKLGHEVVMSPTDYCYIDYMQGDPALEPPCYDMLRLSKAYQFEPVPDGIDPKLILGGQANLWTEQVYNYRHVQYMVWPRAFATAEALWSPKSGRDWTDFMRRVEGHFQRYDKAGIKYAPAVYDPLIKARKGEKGALVLDTENELSDLSTHYSFDNSFPDAQYPAFTGPVTVPDNATQIKVVNCRGGKVVGRIFSIPVSDLRKRAEEK